VVAAAASAARRGRSDRRGRGGTPRAQELPPEVLEEAEEELNEIREKLGMRLMLVKSYFKSDKTSHILRFLYQPSMLLKKWGWFMIGPVASKLGMVYDSPQQLLVLNVGNWEMGWL